MKLKKIENAVVHCRTKEEEKIRLFRKEAG